MNCEHCNGECCSLEKREGTIRYAQLLPHGKGVHYCKYCDNGEPAYIRQDKKECWERGQQVFLYSKKV
jgi:hypothetical protein